MTWGLRIMSNQSEEPKIETPTSEEVAQFGQADSAVPSEPSPVDTELQKTLRERDEFKDKWLRAKADAQNQARRLRADRDEAVQLATADFARSVLMIVDNMERAVDSAVQNPDVNKLIEGVRIVHDALLKMLIDHQIERIDSEGKPFDPTQHQAITQQVSAEHPEGTVIKEVQPGYKLRDRVLRPAGVIVSVAPKEEQKAG